MDNEIAHVTLRHPHTGHTVEVANTSAELVPYMVLGYSQVPDKTPVTTDTHEEEAHHGS